MTLEKCKQDEVPSLDLNVVKSVGGLHPLSRSLDRSPESRIANRIAALEDVDQERTLIQGWAGTHSRFPIGESELRVEESWQECLGEIRVFESPAQPQPFNLATSECLASRNQLERFRPKLQLPQFRLEVLD